MYDGASKDELETWLDQIEIACQVASREQDIKKGSFGKIKRGSFRCFKKFG